MQVQNPQDNAPPANPETLSLNIEDMLRSRAGGSLLIIGLSLVLALLLIVWKGYDLRSFSSVPIGDNMDTLGIAAMVEQGIKNLTTFPIDLTRFNALYPSPNPFAYTAAPYGISVFFLPVYFLTSRNITLTMNLYLVASLVLTAWSVYLLVRYLFAAPLRVAMLAGLITCFSQYNFIQLPHVHVMSLQFLIFGFYCLHRFLDSARLRWALAAGASFWLTFFTTGYLGIIFIFGGFVITVLTLVWRRRQLTLRLFLNGLIAAALTAIASYPFAVMRTDPSLQLGYSLSSIQDFSATIQDWFSGTSLLYRPLTPLIPERALFIGVVPIVLSVLAWRYRKQPNSEPTASMLTGRQVVILYTLIAVMGYLLSLGPSLSFNGGMSIPSPYRLLLLLPGLNFIRAPARFIIMALIGTSVLSAFALTALSRRLRPGQFSRVYALACVLLVVELFPYSQRLEPESNIFRLNQAMPQVPVKAYEWLDAQTTPVAFHFPVGIPIENYYFFESQNFHDSMLNGVSSFMPDWYRVVDWNTFPSDATLDYLQALKIPYVLVHRRFLSNDAIVRVNEALQHYALAGRLAYVTTLDNVDIYRVLDTTDDNMVVDFDLPPNGEGWSLTEADGDTSFVWTIASTVTLDLPTPADRQYDSLLQFFIRGAMPGVMDQFSLTVNGHDIALARQPSGSGSLFSGTIPKELLGADSLHLVFHTGEPVSPSDSGTSVDRRKLGVQFDWLKLTTPQTLSTVNLDSPQIGDGWDVLEKTDAGTQFHWMNATTATVTLNDQTVDDLALIFTVDHVMSDDILKSLTVEADGQPLALTSTTNSYVTTFRTVIPRQIMLKGSGVQLTFRVNRTLSPHERDASTEDTRQLAIGLSGMWTYPLHDVRLQPGNLPVDDGWSAPIQTRDGLSFRWMTAKQTQLTLPLPTDQPLTITLGVLQNPSGATADNLTLSVNDIPVPLAAATANGRTVLRGTIPASSLASRQGAPSTLAFAVNDLAPVIGSMESAFDVEYVNEGVIETRPAPPEAAESSVQYGLALGSLQIQGNVGLVPNEIQVSFDSSLKGDGWYDSETLPDQTPFRWMKSTTATVEIAPPKPAALILLAQIQGGVTPEITRSLTLKVNDQPVDFKLMDASSDTYRAVIPAAVVQNRPDATTLAFTVDKLVSPAELGQGQDVRALGVAFKRLKIYPADQVVVNFDDLLEGSGWYDVEQDATGDFRWMSGSSASVTAPFVPGGEPEQVVFQVAQGITDDILKSLKLTVNGDEIALQHDPAQATHWWGVIPASTLAKSTQTGTINLSFMVEKAVSPQALGLNDDTRTLGVALRWLWILPQTGSSAVTAQTRAEDVLRRPA